jgi:hypothetical protein
LNERIANDLTVTERAEAQRAQAERSMGEARARGAKIDRALSTFLRSLIPSVKVGDRVLVQ